MKNSFRANQNGLERGGHDWKPETQVFQFGLFLSRRKTPAKENITPEPILVGPPASATLAI
ncbi:hypothetical protein FD37_GL000397 [Levilactobacillus spicheri DSM 15429]|uniref:Uncharacterized protein n=2 Tax=Levilactobacillus spicheri TaxID=216463 RepID=A0ABQ0WSN3_9LACO|nr:hypothetical protein FD37_GL000397 [Levilactobacillus spicheri DSM 15429]GEO66550.1 hypothetical protein LSP04_09690 [Levilactobacillus spicheri]